MILKTHFTTKILIKIKFGDAVSGLNYKVLISIHLVGCLNNTYIVQLFPFHTKIISILSTLILKTQRTSKVFWNNM